MIFCYCFTKFWIVNYSNVGNPNRHFMMQTILNMISSDLDIIKDVNSTINYNAYFYFGWKGLSGCV